MTLPASGAITLAQVNTELQRSSTALLEMNDGELRALARQWPSGQVDMNALHSRQLCAGTVTAADAGISRGYQSGGFGSISSAGTAPASGIFTLCKFTNPVPAVELMLLDISDPSQVLSINSIYMLIYNGTVYLASSATFSGTTTKRWQWGASSHGPLGGISFALYS